MSKKICVYAICKNEIKFIDKWLDNMSEADYIVVLDTGSTDGTYERLESDPRITKVKQKIIKPWRFDVARNESMKLVPADADILVCTDFDELFEAGWVEHVRNAWELKPNINRVFYSYAWSHDDLGTSTDVFKYDKIHNRDFIWKYPVHEVLVEKDENVIPVFADASGAVWLHHFPDMQKSRTFYFDLLKLSCEENPDDPHVQMLYAREFRLQGKDDLALPEYLKCLDMPAIKEEKSKLVFLDSLFNTAEIYANKRNYDEAVWYCHEFILNDKTYKEPYYLLAEIYIATELYSIADAMIYAANKNCTRKFNWVERAKTWTYWEDDILSLLKYKEKKLDEAIEHVQKALKHESSDVRMLKNYIAFLEEKYTKKEEE